MDRPTYEEVAAYARQRGFLSNPEEFFTRYQNNGWMKNGQPVYNWRALFQAWEREEKKRAKPAPAPLPQQDPEPESSPEELAALIADIERLKAENLREIEEYQKTTRHRMNQKEAQYEG